MRKIHFHKDFFKSRKFIAILLIAVAILIEFVSAFIYHNYNDSVPFLETLYYSTQIVSSIFVTSGVIVAVWQYYLSSKSIKTDLEIQQVQRAIDLSEYYKDNILTYYPAIRYIFKQTGILDIIETLRINDLHDFDIIELNRLFSPKQVEDLKNIQSSENFNRTVMESNLIYKLNNNIKQMEVLNNSEEKNVVLVAYISSLMDELLNNMEFFSLHFAHKTADESVVYQSLHQTYLEIVRIMYYEIANKNTTPTEKYYTNIIWLFDNWRTQKNKKSEEHSINSRSLQSMGTVIKE